MHLRLATPGQIMQAGNVWAEQPEGGLRRVLVAMGVLTEQQAEMVAALIAQRGAEVTPIGGLRLAPLGLALSAHMPSLDGKETIPGAPPAGGPVCDATETLEETPGRYVDFVEFARGGFGRVWRAFDTQLGREVALKELAPRMPGGAPRETPTAQIAPRFLREARITSQLEHPSIVPVYEVGRRQDGRLYYTMKLVRGRTLAEAIHQAKSLKERLALLPHYVDLCQAVAYAHSRGVIHRDLKPSNVMVGEFGETVVLDWGLAKPRHADSEGEPAAPTRETPWGLRMEEAPPLGFTTDGEAVGTPAYMPPEQARGELDRIDERSDVYSLGVVLFELLTARLPFEGSNVYDMLRQVAEGTAPDVAKIQEDAPRELCAICQRAVARAQDDRYPTAKELAEDIARFQSGALVSAHVYGFREYLRRFVRRYWPQLALASAAAVIVACVAVYSYLAVVRERNRALESEQAAHAAEAQTAAANENLQAALETAEEARAAAESARRAAQSAQEAAQQELYFSQVSLANQHIARRAYNEARAALAAAPEANRRWEWGWLEAQCNAAWRSIPLPPQQGMTGRVPAVSDREGRRWAIYDPAGSVQVIDGYTGLNVTGAQGAVDFKLAAASDRHQLSPDGQQLALVAGGRLRIFHLPSGKAVYDEEWKGLLNWLGFSGDGMRMAGPSGLDDVLLYDTADWHALREFKRGYISNGFLTEQGDFLALLYSREPSPAQTRGSAALINVASGRTRLDVPVASKAIAALLEGPLRLALADQPDRIAVLDGQDGAVLHRFHFQGTRISAISPALGDRIAVGTETGEVFVLDARTGETVLETRHGSRAARAVRLLGDGATVASGGEDGVVYVEAAGGHSGPREFRGHTRPVLSLAADAAGTVLWSCDESELKAWSLEAPGFDQHVGVGAMGGSVLPGTARLAGIGADGKVFAVDLQTHHVSALGAIDRPEARLLLSPSSTHALERSTNGIVLWELAASRPFEIARGRDEKWSPAAFSTDGARLYWLHPHPGKKQLWLECLALHAGGPRVEAREAVLLGEERPHTAAALLCTPAGEVLVLHGGQLVVCDGGTGKPKASQPIPALGDRLGNFAVLDAQARRVAYPDASGGVSIAAVGLAESVQLARHQAPVSAIAFAPAGDRIATGMEDGSVSLCDAESGREILLIPGDLGPVRVLGFAGDALVIGGEKGCRILHPFTARETPLAGSTDTPIALRRACQTFESEFTAPAWARCQARLAALERAQDTPGELAAVCVVGTPYTRAEDTKGYRCPLHGELNNLYHLESSAEALDRAIDAGAPDTASAEEQFHKAAMRAREQLPQLAAQWVRENRNYHAVLAAAETLEGATRKSFAQTEILAALAVNLPERAVSAARLLDEKENVGLIAYVLASRGQPGDQKEACTYLLRGLRALQDDAWLRKAYETLQAAPSPASEGALREAAALLYPPEDAWRRLPWAHGIAAALGQAKGAGKPVLALASDPVSQYDALLKTKTLGRPDMQERLAREFVLCEANADLDAALLEENGVTTLPALLVMNAAGGPMYLHEGHLGPAELESEVLAPAEQRGVIRTWAVAGPFRDGDTPGASGHFPAEEAQAEGGNPFQDGLAQWEECLPVNLAGRFVAARYFKDAAPGELLLCTALDAPHKMKCSLRYNVTGGAAIWVNEKSVVHADLRKGRGAAGKAAIALRPGLNHLLVRLTSADTPATLWIELRPLDGQELPRFSVPDGLPRRAPIPGTLNQESAEVPEEAGLRTLHLDKDDILSEWRKAWRKHGYNLLIEAGVEFLRDEAGAYYGARLQRASGLTIAKMLDLRDGDVVLKLNGIALSAGADLQAYQSAIEQLRDKPIPEWILELERDGKPLTHVYQIEY